MNSSYYQGMISDYQNKKNYYQDVISNVNSLLGEIGSCTDLVDGNASIVKSIIINGLPIYANGLSNVTSLLKGANDLLQDVIAECIDKIDECDEKIASYNILLSEALARESITTTQE